MERRDLNLVATVTPDLTADPECTLVLFVHMSAALRRIPKQQEITLDPQYLAQLEGLARWG